MDKPGCGRNPARLIHAWRGGRPAAAAVTALTPVVLIVIGSYSVRCPIVAASYLAPQFHCALI